MPETAVRYLVFNAETVADGDLVARLRYPGEPIEPQEAVRCYRAEMRQKYDNEFIPYTYQFPISISVGKVTEDFRLTEVVLLDEPQFRPHVITEHFWRGWEKYRWPTLVSFHGRSFDIPLLELAAFRYGVGLPGWYNIHSRSGERKARFSQQLHIDVADLLSNFGAARFSGGLTLAANLLGKPGKTDIRGDMIQALYDDGQVAQVNEHCRHEVLDTYFVFLRTRVLVGQLTLDAEQQLIARTRQWIEERAAKHAGFRLYLERWGDWANPWAKPVPDPPETAAP